MMQNTRSAVLRAGLLVLAVLAVQPTLLGQTKKVQVTASVSPATAAPGDTVELKLDVKVDAPWYIYDPDPGSEFTTPSRVVVSAGALEPVGKARFPKPVTKEIFEETVRTHQGSFQITWPHKVKAAAKLGKQSIDVKLHYGPCNADTGVCLAPTSISATAALEIAQGTAPAPDTGDNGDTGKESFNLLQDELLGGGLLGGKDSPTGGVGDAPKSHVRWTLVPPTGELVRGEKALLEVKYDLDDRWHIYAPPIEGVEVVGIPTEIRFAEGQAVQLGVLEYPEPENFQGQRALSHSGTIRVPFYPVADLQPGKTSLDVTVLFQECDDKTCLPPDSLQAKIEVTISEAAAVAMPEEGAEPKDEGGNKESPPLLLFLLEAILWGLFTLLMPCTYPMIPITISYFGKQAEKAHGSIFPMALTYGFGIILIFVLIGVFIGKPIVDFAAGWPLNVALGVLFVVFALSLFGAFEIRLPSFLMNVSSKATMRGGYAGVFVLGMTLVVTSFTCTAPFVGALLGTGAKEGYGRLILGMGVFGATVAAPFVILALLPAGARKLPKSGQWMQTLKVTLGFVELAAALKFFSNVDLVLSWEALPRELFFLWWAALAFITGLYLLGMVPLKTEPGQSIGPVQMTFGVLAILLGAYWMQGADGKRLDFISMSIAPPYSSAKEVAGNGEVKPDRIIVKDDFVGGMRKALSEGKLAFINWTGVT